MLYRQQQSLSLFESRKAVVSLNEMGVPQHLIIPVSNLYCGQEAIVGTEYRETMVFYGQRCQIRVQFISLFV